VLVCIVEILVEFSGPQALLVANETKIHVLANRREQSGARIPATSI
jgi:hypothetical protein